MPARGMNRPMIHWAAAENRATESGWVGNRAVGITPKAPKAETKAGGATSGDHE